MECLLWTGDTDQRDEIYMVILDPGKLLVAHKELAVY